MPGGYSLVPGSPGSCTRAAAVTRTAGDGAGGSLTDGVVVRLAHGRRPFAGFSEDALPSVTGVDYGA